MFMGELLSSFRSSISNPNRRVEREFSGLIDAIESNAQMEAFIHAFTVRHFACRNIWR